MEYIEIKSLFAEDEIKILKNKYKIRFTPRYAEHIWDNYEDNAHKIKHTEIRSIVKRNAILIPTDKPNAFHCLSKFKGKIYFMPVVLEDDSFLVKTAYRCSSISLILTYNQYEYQSGE